MIRPLSDDEKAANWRAAAKAGRRLFWLAMVPFLALLWLAGYALGWLDGHAAATRPATPETISKESN